MTPRVSVNFSVIFIAAAAAFLGGCGGNGNSPGTGQSQIPKPGPGTYETKLGSGRIGIDDPCATTLHDLGELFLRYYITHDNRLPERLEELKVIKPNLSPKDLVCPESGQPYVYEPTGLTINNRDYLVILYDPVPAHGGIRQAIVRRPSRPGQSVVIFDVAEIPEPFFIPLNRN